ncbi:hypothetical protein GCM10023152_12350 [Agromyces bauzanensis]|uniref:SnoaL-like domain-containing protein n=1 Tax=Agromyces bauzanensis TaxID=1308924 RepID=A0A917ULV7_9MICO|nr:hypothetical protein GCM10011372_00580 [Agromyces bauzanensis]
MLDRDRFTGKAGVRAGLARRYKGIPDVHYGNDRHLVCSDGFGVSESTPTGTSIAGQSLEVRGVDLLEYDDDGRITRKDSFWKLLE